MEVLSNVPARDDDREHILGILKAVARAIVNTFGPDLCEVVIHDFSDLEHSIIWIEGDVTHRHPGGAMTDLGLAVVRSGEFEDLYNYRTYLEDGKTLKSSSIFLREKDGRVWGAFCINFNVTPFLNMQQFIGSFTAAREDQEIRETFSDNIEDTLRRIIADCAAQIGKSVDEMGRQERLELIQLLDQRGAFQVRRAVPIVAQSLDVSRYTIYNYLAEVRGGAVPESTDYGQTT